MRSQKYLAAAALLSLGLSCGQAQAWVTKEVRDWTVECSNGLTCDMSFSDWGAKGVQYVGFQRKGAPHAAIELRLRTAPDFAPDADPQVTYRFTVDGNAMLMLTARDLKQEESGMAFHYPDQAKVTALLNAMAFGKSAEVEVTGKAGRQVLPIKLSGVKGAMLYLDEVQGRLDRVDALEAKGDKQPAQDMTAKDVLSLEDMPEIVRKDFTDAGGACADLDPATIGQFQGFDVAVGSTRLIGVPCGTGGAYNQPYALYAAYDVIVERISFPYMDEGKPTAMTTAMNIDFNPVTRIMTAFFRGRGIGDCGEYFKWQLDENASSLELLEMRTKGECDEQGNDPAAFPLTWKAGQ